jgi:hypothetical protein
MRMRRSTERLPPRNPHVQVIPNERLGFPPPWRWSSRGRATARLYERGVAPPTAICRSEANHRHAR